MSWIQISESDTTPEARAEFVSGRLGGFAVAAGGWGYKSGQLAQFNDVWALRDDTLTWF